MILKLLFVLTIFIIANSIFYLGVSYIAFNWNPMEWSTNVRAMVCFVEFCIMGGSFLLFTGLSGDV